MVERLFIAVPWGCLRFVIVVFPDHTHLIFWKGIVMLIGHHLKMIVVAVIVSDLQECGHLFHKIHICCSFNLLH